MPAIDSEKGVKREVKKLLDRYGWFWWMPAANGYGRAGIADFNALKNGVFLAVETKFGKNRPTPAQKAFIGSIMAESGMGFVVNEDNLSFLEQWLKAFDESVDVVRISGGDPTKAVDHEHGALMLNAMAKLTELL